MKHERDDDWSTWELYLAEMQRVSRAISINTLWTRREMSRRRRPAEIPSASTCARLKYFCLCAKGDFIPSSFSLIRHLSLSVYMYRSYPVWLSRGNAVLLSRALSTATNRESTSEVKSEIRKVWRVAVPYWLAEGRDFSPLRYFRSATWKLWKAAVYAIMKISRRGNSISTHYAGTQID